MKTVLITGASSGIGLATAKKFLSEGWSVIGTSPSGGTLFDGVESIKLDYLMPATIQTAVGKIEKMGKNIDVLVNNAAINEDGEKQDAEIRRLKKTLDVNLIGPIEFTEKLVPIISEDGHVINISSFSASLTEFPEWNWLMPTYRISKAAIDMYTKVLAKRLTNIKVSALDPGWVKTALGGENAPRTPEEVADEIFNLANTDVETGNFWFKGKKRSW